MASRLSADASSVSERPRDCCPPLVLLDLDVRTVLLVEIAVDLRFAEHTYEANFQIPSGLLLDRKIGPMKLPFACVARLVPGRAIMIGV